MYITKQQAWQIYDAARAPAYRWEHPETRRGLLLATCNGCGKAQTRETYCTFWEKGYTLKQGPSITAIAQHHCGAWHRNDD